VIRSFVRVYERDFTRLRALPTGLVFTPIDWSHAAIGGPKAATFTAEGPVQSLWAMLAWLRSPVEIASERGDIIWWGFVHEIEAEIGAIRIGVSLDGVANKVAVQYEQLALNETTTGSSATTPYAIDSDSVALFGTRELLAALTNATETIARAQRDRLLAALKNPIPVLSLEGGGRNRVTVHCRGWWEVLGWQAYGQVGAGTGPVQSPGYNQTAEQPYRWAHRFRLRDTEQPFRARVVDVQLSVDGSNPLPGPHGNIEFQLFADNAGAMGAAISGIGYQACGEITPQGNYYKVWLAEPHPILQKGTYYWLRIYNWREWVWSDPELGGTEKFTKILWRTPSGWAEGELYRAWGGGAWQLMGDSHLMMYLNGEQETTAQLVAMVDALKQGMITGCTVQTASGLYTSAYRPANANGLEEIAQLLDVGTINGRRLLGHVTDKREVVIFEEPVSNAATDLRVTLSGVLEDANGWPVEKALFRPGRWARLAMAEQGEAELGKLGPISPVFVEESEYTAARDELRVRTRDRRSVWDVGGVVQ
jgi:hypothetical protein